MNVLNVMFVATVVRTADVAGGLVNTINSIYRVM